MTIIPDYQKKSLLSEALDSLDPSSLKDFEQWILAMEKQERQELQAKRAKTISYREFVQSQRPEYMMNWHHNVVTSHLQLWVDGTIKRLMILMPPGHAKSDYASRYLTPYIWGRNPNAQVISSAHTQDLATTFNLDVQTVMDTEQYRDIFPGVWLAGSPGAPRSSVPYQRNTTSLHTVPHRGRYRSAGIRGSITGHRANYFILDDMFKDRIEAESEIDRDDIWTRYRSTVFTRLFADASILLVVTRWHPDDLVGRLEKLAKDDPNASQWVVLRFPAVLDEEPLTYQYGSVRQDPRKHGEPLWPAMFPLEFLQEVRANLGTYEWNGLYQQRPTGLSGNMFNPQWLKDATAEPMHGEMVRVRFWDKAATEGGGAYTAGFLMAYDPRDGTVYLVDCVRGQWGAGEREKIIRQTAEADAAFYHSDSAVSIWEEQEGGSGGKFDAQETIRNLVGFVVHAEPASGQGSKTVRAMPFAAYCENKNVVLLRSQERPQAWIKPFLEEFGKFPRGTYKDQMDAASGAFRRIRMAKTRQMATGGTRIQAPTMGQVRQFAGR